MAKKKQLIVYIDGVEHEHKEPGDGTVWVKINNHWMHIAMVRNYK